MKLFALSIVFVICSGRPADSNEPEIPVTSRAIKSNGDKNIIVVREPQVIRSFNPSPMRVTTPKAQTIVSGSTLEEATKPDITRFADQSKLLLTMNKRLTVLPVQESLGGQISLEDKQSLRAVIQEDKIYQSLPNQNEQLLRHLPKYSNADSNRQPYTAPTTTMTTTTTTTSTPKTIKQEEVMNLLLKELPMLDIMLNGDNRMNSAEELYRQRLQPGQTNKTGNRATATNNRRQIPGYASQAIGGSTLQSVDMKSLVNKANHSTVDRNTNLRKKTRTPCFFNAITCT